MTLTQDGWKRDMVAYWSHPDLPGWEVAVGQGSIHMFTPEGEAVTDNEGNAWEFNTLDEAYEFAKLALDPEGV